MNSLQKPSSGGFNERDVLNGGGGSPHGGIVFTNFVAIANLNGFEAWTLYSITRRWKYSYRALLGVLWPQTREKAQQK